MEHTIYGYTSASSTVQVSLVPISATIVSQDAPVKYCAQVDKWGNEKLGVEPINGWEESADEGAKLLERCEKLLQEFAGDKVSGVTASKA